MLLLSFESNVTLQVRVLCCSCLQEKAISVNASGCPTRFLMNCKGGCISTDSIRKEYVLVGCQFSNSSILSLFAMELSLLSASQRNYRNGFQGHRGDVAIAACLDLLAQGSHYRSYRSDAAMPPETLRQYFQKFLDAVLEEFGEFLAWPSRGALKSIQANYEKRGMPGCLGCIDCVHIHWKNVPTAQRYAFVGKDGKPSFNVEAVSDKRLYCWHLSVGHPGGMNDLNVMRRSSLVQSMLRGEFSEGLEFFVGDRGFRHPYLLADGIYPSWPLFMVPYGAPEGVSKERRFDIRQESLRKDVERLFGCVKGRWRVLLNDMQTWSAEEACKVIKVL